MTWQDGAVFAIVCAALAFLAWKFVPRRRRHSKKPDVKASDLVRRRDDPVKRD